MHAELDALHRRLNSDDRAPLAATALLEAQLASLTAKHEDALTKVLLCLQLLLACIWCKQSGLPRSSRSSKQLACCSWSILWLCAWYTMPAYQAVALTFRVG